MPNKGEVELKALVQSSSLPIKKSCLVRLKEDIKKFKIVYMMALPVILYYLVFHYAPMYGAVIAFKNFNLADGIWGSEWVGLQNFMEFFNSRYFTRLLFNTLNISLNTLVWGFPAPIILALLLNELKGKVFSKTVQTITYLPHFISLVVICGMIQDFTSEKGIIVQLLSVFGFRPQNMLNNKNLFVPIYVISNIWQEVGWSSIVYLAALAGIEPELYEAAKIDGAGKLRQTLSITLPGLIPTIMVMLILRVGSLLNVGYEKIILLYNELTYETADIISSFTYRRGLQEFAWSYSAAVGLFNAVINFILLILANTISKKMNHTSLW
ncbi:MAG: sugar ABC transporter permease [Clostridia bacterium]|nr:sugar ABC transporter permease [Clostridia bacterium]